MFLIWREGWEEADIYSLALATHITNMDLPYYLGTQKNSNPRGYPAAQTEKNPKNKNERNSYKKK